MKKIDLTNLFHSIYPFFLTFIVGRLVNQTDVIMASQISANAAAAFAIPVRISIIDMIVAFSLAPVISVLVAEKTESKERTRIVQMCLTITFYLSLILTALGLLIYPLFVKMLVPNQEIAQLATSAVTWLTLSIPIRLCYFAISMAIHGSGNGKYLPIVGIFNLALNIVLNYLFIYPLNFGFAGIYIATFITSIISLTYAGWVLQSKSKIPIRFVSLDKDWCINFFYKQFAEFSRVASERILSLVEVAIIASALGSALLSFSIGSEFLFLMYTPFLAVLRGTAIEITKCSFADFSTKYDAVKSLAKKGFIVLALFALALLPLYKIIAEKGYNMPSSSLEWWKYIFIFGCLAIPLKWVDALQRASFQADKKLHELAKIDIVIDWCISIPILFTGIALESPLIAFSFFIITPTLKILAMHFKSLQMKAAIPAIVAQI